MTNDMRAGAWRWAGSLAALAGIVLVYHRWLAVNATTVALTMLLLVLAVAAKWSLRYAVVLSLAATACYNFYFLEPTGTFVIRDRQNWVALLAFLAVSVIGSRLSERARDEANARAKAVARVESERLRTLMLDSVAHELRTPLTSIKGAATTLLGSESISPQDQRELLTIVDEESDRLNQMIEQAVEMAELEAHHVRMHIGPVALSEIVEQAMEACAWVRKQHTVCVDVNPSIAVTADPEMIRKALCNLLENAGKYAGEGAMVRVFAEKAGERVRVWVEDNGPGIVPGEEELIFARLYRSQGEGGVPGTGMGLPISRAIAEAHGGSLTVESAKEWGTRFCLELVAAV